MIKRRFFAKAAFGVMLSISLALSSCGGGIEPRTDTLIVGVAAMPTNLDPTLSNDIPTARLIAHIFDTLIYTDYDMNLQPNVATSWEWVDPSYPVQLRMTLRQGVMFHNGDMLTARDVQFSLERASQAPVIASLANMIDSVTIVNDHEIIINLSHPFVPMMNFLGHTALSIVNERAVTEMGVPAHSMAPVGTGPYRLTNIVAGDRVEFVRWENYWGEPAILENLIVRTMADASTRLIALETGEIDIMLDVPPTDMNRVAQHPNLTLFAEESFAINFIAFNTSRPPFDDVRVRHAVQHAINLPAMVQAVYLGALGVGRGPLNSRVWASVSDQLELFEHNPQRARDLLAEAGLSNGFSTTFFTNQGNPQRADTAEIMQNMLRDVGIEMAVQILEWGTFLDVTAAGEPDMMMMGWVTTTGDPHQGLHAVFHSDNFGAGGNRGFFSNPQVDALLDAGMRETDPVLRAEIYYQAQRIIRDESPWIFQSTGTEIIGVRNNVQGFRVAPNMRHKFWTLSFADN